MRANFHDPPPFGAGKASVLYPKPAFPLRTIKQRFFTIERRSRRSCQQSARGLELLRYRDSMKFSNITELRGAGICIAKAYAGAHRVQRFNIKIKSRSPWPACPPEVSSRHLWNSQAWGINGAFDDDLAFFVSQKVWGPSCAAFQK